jgi:signal peptidase
MTAIAVPLALAITIGPLLLPYRTYHVRSGSMEPAIRTGALVVLAEVDAEEIDIGDIITFDRPDGAGGRVTHRVIDVISDGGGRAFLTKGDANDVPDPWRVPVAGTQLRHVFDVPILGYLFGWLSSPLARAGLLAVPAVALAWLTWSERRARPRTTDA